jgi:drug/metabolite transporter (DMT)-like permease
MDLAGLRTITWVSVALLAASIEPLIVKSGYQSGANPMSLLAWKLVLGPFFLGPLMGKLRKLPAHRRGPLIWIGLCFTLHYLLVYLALARVSASVLVTGLASTPIWVALVNQLRLGEKPGAGFWFWLVVCSFGVLLSLDLISTTDIRFDPLGLAFCAGAVTSSVFYRLLVDHLTVNLEPLAVSAAIFAISGFAGGILLPWTGPMGPQGYLSAAWMAFAGAAANVAFVHSIKFIGSTRMSVLTLLQRPIVIVLAAILLQERLTLSQFAGVALVLLGARFSKVRKKAWNNPSNANGLRLRSLSIRHNR